MTDPYKVLGVSPSATDEEIKDAYRKLAKKHHPDQYGDSPLSELAGEKMKEINEAYDTIVSQRKNRGANNNGYGSTTITRTMRVITPGMRGAAVPPALTMYAVSLWRGALQTRSRS